MMQGLLETINEELKSVSFVDVEEHYTDNGQCLVKIEDVQNILIKYCEFLPTEDIWAKEFWYDDDLKMALINQNVEPTKDNVERLKKECFHLFDDKSERNEMIADMVDIVFR